MFNSYQILKNIEKKLFGREQARFTKKIDQLCDQNQEIARKQLDGFMFEGKFYRRSTSLTGANSIRNTLRLELWSEMHKLQADQRQVECDKGLIHQFLFRLYGGCFNAQQLRDATFDEIVDCLPDDAKSLTRCSQMSFFFNNSEDYKEYAQIHPLVQFYSAARMIY